MALHNKIAAYKIVIRGSLIIANAITDHKIVALKFNRFCRYVKPVKPLSNGF